ncbi:YjfB family protein [Acetobacterium sp.]|uniref:YjfB family protein n=1 Tax=Acetobacterium sp. TaxID=1872094 RepID=UPI002F3E6596
MDIAAVSMSLSQMQVSQQASVSVLKMAMETGTQQMTEMIKMAESTTAPAAPSPSPTIGQMFDVTV